MVCSKGASFRSSYFSLKDSEESRVARTFMCSQVGVSSRTGCLSVSWKMGVR